MPATARLTIKMQMFTHALNLASRGCCTNFEQFVQKSAVSGCFWKALRASLTAFVMLRFSTDEEAPRSAGLTLCVMFYRLVAKAIKRPETAKKWPTGANFMHHAITP